MNAFPSDYVAHNLPLVLLSGLESASNHDHESAESSRYLLHEGGFRIKTDLPPVSGLHASELLRRFLESDASEASWNSEGSIVKERGGTFKIRSIGRVGQTLHSFPDLVIRGKLMSSTSHIICRYTLFLLAKPLHLLIRLDFDRVRIMIVLLPLLSSIPPCLLSHQGRRYILMAL
jgi:trafficking protein particle complex subunit 11